MGGTHRKEHSAYKMKIGVDIVEPRKGQRGLNRSCFCSLIARAISSLDLRTHMG